MFKEKTATFLRYVCVIDGQAVINTIVLGVASLCAIISPAFGSIVFCLGWLYTFLEMIMSFTVLCKLKEDKRLFALFFSMVVYILAILLFLYLLGKSSMGSLISDYRNYF